MLFGLFAQNTAFFRSLFSRAVNALGGSMASPNTLIRVSLEAGRNCRPFGDLTAPQEPKTKGQTHLLYFGYRK
jgi:hypothetical protein